MLGVSRARVRQLVSLQSIAGAPGSALGGHNVLSATQTHCNYLMTGYRADA